MFLIFGVVFVLSAHSASSAVNQIRPIITGSLHCNDTNHVLSDCSRNPKMRYFFTCCVLLLSALSAHAATPSAALRVMPQKAISLRWQKLPTDAKNAIWLHIYCVPTGRDPQLKYLGMEKTGPITRGDITTGPSLKASPFWLDIFADANAKRRLNSVKFEENKDVQDIVLRWLEPKTKRGPVLLMNFGYTHWYEWQTFTFARGWSGAAHAQTFLYGGEGDIYSDFRFDRTDAQGRLIVVEDEGLENGKTRVNTYRWNGREWDDPNLKYFVIGSAVKDKSAIEALNRKMGYGEVVRSDDYPKLRAGYWMWILGRFRTQAEANELVKITDKKKPVTVRLAR